MSPQTEFGLGGVRSSAAICFPSDRSLFTVMYFSLRLNIRCRFRLRQGAQYPLEVNVLHSWAVVLSKFSGKSSLYE